MKISALLLVFALLSPSVSSAASYGLRQAAGLPSMVGRATRNIGRPRFASVKGTYEGLAFALHLSRSLWVLSGDRGEDAIGVKIDHDGKSMLGDIGGRRVELAFHWTPNSSIVQGTYDGKPIRYTVDFRGKAVAGSYAGNQFRLALDEKSGKVVGGLGGKAVSLTYNPMSGRLDGTLAGRSVDVALVNVDLGEFLQYFFVLLP